ncbi:MAG: hypothetical protein CVT84_17730 [Alphaproteobacteria bacterium HGW-Alphaproteobacteria-6]|nr:MAG: hypothetical protein CVT84_17730 [Alphaproteobacteria bacterium HGW-Alphaproteobacteria-6]
MIVGAFLAALGQIGDRRFLRVLVLGTLLAAALLVALSAGVALALDALLAGSLDLPFLGPVSWAGDLFSWAAFALMLVLSVFLMVPVASLFGALFLDSVAEAVEDRHYPGLAPAPRLPVADLVIDAVNFLGVLIAVNALALLLYALVGPFAPLLFWAVNGYLLGREYFQMVAMRRIGRVAARALRRRHAGRIWLAGILMAAPLSLPLVGLVIPVLGVATFTHLFHRLASRAGA